MSKDKKTSHRLTWPKGLLIYFGSLVFVIGAISGIYSVAFADTIYPKVSVAGVDLGGLTKEQAAQKLADKLANHAFKPVTVTYEGQSFTIQPEQIEAKVNASQSVEAAYAVGRSNDLLTNLTEKLTAPFVSTVLPVAVDTQEKKLDESIDTIERKVTVPVKEADLAISEGVATITKPESGKVMDKTKLKEQILDQLGQQSELPITLTLSVKPSVILEADVEPVKNQAETILKEPLTFTANDKTFTADAKIIGQWLMTKKINDRSLELVFAEDKIKEYVSSLAKQIDTAPENARLTTINGTVTALTQSKDGLTLDREKAQADIVTALNGRKDQSAPSAPIALNVAVKKAATSSENLAQLERIAVSSSDFTGSPGNRQENIRLGAKLFNGLIIQPGEQFSTLKALGNIDEASGFKPELVIKQDQLTPEVGGGLCQVSTTLFRTVLNAGLKVDDRVNHRFRVSYYEKKPAKIDPEDYVTNNAKTLVGLDATIYDPKPDFTFTNDTGSFILIQSKVEGTTITFEFFGKKDGRKVAINGPFITSRIPAPTTVQYIPDPSLPAGATKLKEKAVPGARAYFTYTVTKDGQELHKDTFNSTYTAWQAKYYKGGAVPQPPSPNPDPLQAETLAPAPSPAT